MTTELTKQTPSGMELLSPEQMVQVAFAEAIKQGAAMEVVNTIIAQQKWLIQHREEEEFNAALKRIQKQLKTIPKRGHNDQTNSDFAIAQDVDAEIQPLLDQEGMTLTFVPRESPNPEEVVIVACLSLGAYTREYPLPMPADGKGAKGGGVMTRTHATGSAITYGKRYLKNMIFDLRFEEVDDDGNAAGMTQGDADNWIAKMESATDDKQVFAVWVNAFNAAEKAINGKPDYKAQVILTRARDKRLTDLKKGTK